MPVPLNSQLKNRGKSENVLAQSLPVDRLRLREIIFLSRALCPRAGGGEKAHLYSGDPIGTRGDGMQFPEGRIRKIGEMVVPHVPAYELAAMVVEMFVKPNESGQRRRIVAAYLDPSNFKEIGDGHTIAYQINDVLAPWDIVCECASNDRIGGWQLLYRMMRTGEFEITDVCPTTFESLRTRMHDEKKPGDIHKSPDDPLDDVADETRYALYTFIQQAEKPRELKLAESIAGYDRSTREGMTTAAIRWQQTEEGLNRAIIYLTDQRGHRQGGKRKPKASGRKRGKRKV
jgi:hypothetical protein